MQKIVNNLANLIDEDINVTTDKVRALIINDNNEIFIIKYADIYMLPGGKLDDGENASLALKRELKEELGIDVDTQDMFPLMEITNYLKDYPVRNSNNTTNKKTKTTYYVIKGNYALDLKSNCLTKAEEQGLFTVYQTKLDDVKELLMRYSSTNPRYTCFKQDLLSVLEEYKRLYSPRSSETSFGHWLATFGDDRIEPEKSSDEPEDLIDLHMHSIYSDGELTPEQLVEKAYLKGIRTLSITDHDTLLGNQQLLEHSIYLNKIRFIPGIELSANTKKGRMHILGYGIDLNDPLLNGKMQELKDNSLNSVLSIMEQIKKDYGIRFTYNEIKELVNANHNLGRPDVARLLVNNHYANTIQEAFDKYLIAAYAKIQAMGKGLPYEECLALILQSGGIPVLAHPNSLELDTPDLLKLIKTMQTLGLQGLEVYHSSHSKQETACYQAIARDLYLLISGGSDFHGPNVKPDIDMGTGKNHNIKIKQLSLLNALTK